jgi:hypothetical protein
MCMTVNNEIQQQWTTYTDRGIWVYTGCQSL